MNSGERERESESVRSQSTSRGSAPFARGRSTSPRRSHAPSSSPRHSQALAPSIAIRDHDLAFALIAIDASRDHAVSRDLAFAPIVISRSVNRDLAKRRGALRDRDRRRGCRTGAHEAPRRRTQSSVNLGFVRVF